jgi:hypothetical protein
MDTTQTLSTTQRYRPFAHAEQKAHAARQAYAAAGLRYIGNPTLDNSNALDASRKAMDEAEKQAAQAGQIWKHVIGKRRPQ